MNTTPNTKLTKIMRIFGKVPLSLLHRLAYIVGSMLYFLKKAKTIRVIQLNTQIAFPQLSEQQHTALSKKAVINEITSYFEFAHIWANDCAHNIKLIHRVHGEEHFHSALAQKQGLVLVMPHFGTWEIMNSWLSQRTHMTIMYKPVKNIELDQFVREARARDNAQLVPTNEVGVKNIFKALKQGGTTVILPDHSPKQDTDLLEWFGVPLYSSHLCAKMIKKTKAKTLFLYALRNENHGFDMHIEPIKEEIYHPEQQGTEVIFEHIEQLITKMPEHYHWSYKRFNANPATHNLYDIPPDEALIRIRNLQHIVP